MALLAPQDRLKLEELLAEMASPVTLAFFTQTIGCETCDETKRILREVAELSPLVSIEEYNFVLDKEKVAEYAIERVPAIAVAGESDTGIRFYGEPAGYEFSTLVDAILMVSARDSGLSEESRALAAAVASPMQIQVFVTPT